MVRRGVDCYCPKGREGEGERKEAKGAWPVMNISCMFLRVDKTSQPLFFLLYL